MEKETIFTKIINKEIPSYKIYEDENHYAFLDISPFEKGHTLVITKKPYETIFDIPARELAELIKVVQKIAKHYEKILGCGINILQNNKEIAHQMVPYIHFHIIPRLERKNLYTFSDKDSYEKEEANDICEKLKLN